MELKEVQEQVDNWIKTYGVRYFSEVTNTLLLVEETGELARLISRKYGEQSFKKDISKEEIKSKIEDEISDVFFVLTCLANQMDIDLENAFRKNIDKKSKRDNKRHINNPKLSR